MDVFGGQVHGQRPGRARNRRGRGPRGPLSLPGPLTPRRIPADRTSQQVFDQLVTDILATIRARALTTIRKNEDATIARGSVDLAPVEVLIEEAPMLPEGWVDAVPTSSINPDGAGGHRIVVYRLPIVTRASSAADLVDRLGEVLVHRLSEAWAIWPDDLS